MRLHYGLTSRLDGGEDDMHEAIGGSARPMMRVERPGQFPSRARRDAAAAERAVDLKRYQTSLKYDDIVEAEYQREMAKAKEARRRRRP